MKRTKPVPQNNTETVSTPLQGDPVARSRTFTQVGLQYDQSRDLYKALGYNRTLTLKHYLDAYERQDIARKINNAPVQATWRGPIRVTDSKEDSGFDAAWDDLTKRLRLWNKLARLDRLVGLGQYAVLVLGFDDVKEDRDFANPVSETGNRKLLYVHPYHQHNAHIESYDNDPNSERYGLPVTYKIYATDANNERQETQDILVHHTRVLHVAENLLESELFGTPRLKAVYNRLEDLAKIVGGSAEMFWRGARPGYAAKLDKDAEIGDQDKEDLQSQLSEFEHDLRRWLRTQGIDIQELSPQVSDPSSHVDVQLLMISACSGIPKRILIGSERGELSSQQDETNWNQNVQDRRENYAEQAILRPLIDRLITYGVLPSPRKEDYEVQWPDLWTPSEKDRANMASSFASAIKAYVSAPGADTLVPARMFLSRILGWPDEDVEAAIEEIQGMAQDEEREAAEDAGEGAIEGEEDNETSAGGGGEQAT